MNGDWPFCDHHDVVRCDYAFVAAYGDGDVRVRLLGGDLDSLWYEDCPFSWGLACDRSCARHVHAVLRDVPLGWHGRQIGRAASWSWHLHHFYGPCGDCRGGLPYRGLVGTWHSYSTSGLF